MRRECRERFPRLQRKPLVGDPGMHHGTCVPHLPWCMSGSLTGGGGGNVPGIPDACTTRKFTYLARGPWQDASEVIVKAVGTLDQYQIAISPSKAQTAWIDIGDRGELLRTYISEPPKIKQYYNRCGSFFEQHRLTQCASSLAATLSAPYSIPCLYITPSYELLSINSSSNS